MQPLRLALRTLIRSPGYSLTAVLTMGGAIGLACSVHAVVRAAFFAPLPYDEATELVQLWQTERPGSSRPQDYIQPYRMEAWVGEGGFRTLQAIAATGMAPPLVVRGGRGARRVDAAPVLGDWFGVLGVRAARGRVLGPVDMEFGAEPAVVVSHTFWEEDLGGGRLGSVLLSGVRYAVVGVMPPSFAPDRKVWVPVHTLPVGSAPVAYAGVGRLREGTGPREAAAEIQHRSAVEVEADSARFAGRGATARPMEETGRRGQQPALWLLGGVVAAVLLVALGNLAILTLVRAQSRTSGLAVRAALGAGRLDLARELLAEGALVGLGGAGLGLALAVWGKDLAAALLVGAPLQPALGPGVVALALGLGAVVTVVLVLAPLRRTGRMDLQPVLQGRSAGAGSTLVERRTQRSLVAAQVAVCVVLTAAAGVLGMAYRGFASLDVGFDARSVVAAHPDWDVSGLDPDRQWQLARRAVVRLADAPELAAATAWRMIGEDFPPRPEFDAVTDGPAVELGTFDGLYRYYEVLPGFFETLDLPLLRGRAFDADDPRGTERVAIVTRRGAELWWPGLDPLGRQIKLGRDGTWMTVVGIAPDLQQLDALGRSAAARTSPVMPLLFVPADGVSPPPPGWRPFDCCSGVRVAARAAGSVTAATEAVRRVLTGEAPDLPMMSLGSIHDVQMAGYQGRAMGLLGGLVGVGVLVTLILALVGIVGVVGESLHRRRREVGVRMALGAGHRQVTLSVARESVLTTLTGVAAGLAALALLREGMATLIFSPTVQHLAPGVLSPEILAPAAALVAFVGLTAVALVSRRALRIDPVEALRAE